jgi:hypothetical protein
MKNLYIIIALVLFSLITQAQITITSSDMPKANDSTRMSKAINALQFNFTQTGANYNWDFSQLQAASQRMEKYLSVNSTPFIYRAVFYGKANLASEREDVSLMNINITDGYNFFNNSASDYRQVGYGASVNGSPMPVSFKDDDILYRFPMNYGNTDSCDSEWEVNIPGLVFINEKKHRVNTIDGWGTITTPYGTFQCIRVKSEVQQLDTIFYSSNNQGFKIPQKYTEYIWLSKSLAFPVLIANIPELSFPTVEYIDSARQFVGIETVTPTNTVSLTIFPNPARDVVDILVETEGNNTQGSINIFNAQGQLVFKDLFTKTYTKKFNHELAPGVYFIRVKTPDHTQIKKLIIQ